MRACSKTQASSKRSSIAGSRPRERPIRPSAGKKRCVAISRVAERASSACLRPIKKVSSLLKSCAAACRTCGDANGLASRNCKRSKTNRRSAKPACASPNPSRIFSPACGRRPKPSTLASVNACCVCSSRRSSSQTTKPSSATRSPCLQNPRLETPTPHPTRPPSPRRRKVIFCVQGETAAELGAEPHIISVLLGHKNVGRQSTAGHSKSLYRLSARTRRAVARRRDQSCAITFADEAVANHAPFESAAAKKAKRLSRMLNE